MTQPRERACSIAHSIIRAPMPRERASGATRTPSMSARHRPYGIEFARRDTQQAFFLVLADAWHRDLETRVIAN